MVAHDLRIVRISFWVATLKIFLFPACWKGMRYAQKFFRINFKFYKFLLGSLRSKSLENRFKNLSVPCLLEGMRYAQKFFRINFKFYKFLFGVAALKIARKSV